MQAHQQLQKVLLLPPVLCLLLLVLLLLLPGGATAVRFNTKAVQGSTCLHDLETGRPLQFDRGEFAELALRARAVHINRHGIRFIPVLQHLREGYMRGWHKVECVYHQSSEDTGSLCSVPSWSSSSSALTTTTTAPPTSSQPPLHILYSEVLPCSAALARAAGTRAYVPRISSLDSVAPPALQRLVQQAAAAHGSAGCHTLGSAAGFREVVIAAQIAEQSLSSSSSYDLTQCDFHEGGFSALFVMDDQVLFLAHGLEISGPLYGFCGILVVLIVSCIAQNIVHLLNHQRSRPAHPDVCLVVCAATLATVIATSEDMSALVVRDNYHFSWGIPPTTSMSQSSSSPFHHLIVTTEELMAFWYMVLYCLIRTVRSAAVRLSTSPSSSSSLSSSSSSSSSLSSSARHHLSGKAANVDHYYNLLVTLLHLLTSRIYMSMSTPYTIGFALLIGVRLFLKLYQLHPSVWNRVVIVADAALLQLLLWAGVMPQFLTPTAAYAGIMVLVFVCVSAARILTNLNAAAAAPPFSAAPPSSAPPP